MRPFPGILPFALVLALSGCGKDSDSLVEPGASLNCKGLNFNATIANADGAATLTKVLKGVVGEQTASPSRYRVSGDFTQLLMCTTPQSSGYAAGPLAVKTAMLATGESLSWDFAF